MVDGGYWGMGCWNGLSQEQQNQVLYDGVLGWGSVPAGTCPNPADLCVETVWDERPGPRFYCLSCALTFLGGLT